MAQDRPRATSRHFKGQVLAGRGQATGHISRFSAEIASAVGADLVPGTLNVILDRPVRLRPEEGRPFDDGFRHLWPARLNGVDVWIYRWRHTALHVVELLAGVGLRRRLGLSDGSEVLLEIDARLIAPTPVSARAAWVAIWWGRRSWCYSNDRYYRRTLKASIALGATQMPAKRKDMHLMMSGVKSIVRRVPVVGPAAKRMFGRPAAAPAPYHFVRQPLGDLSGAARRTAQIRNLLAYTKTSNSSYSAEEFPAGYHTIELDGERLRGQRDPRSRLALVPFDFSGKSVLDIGSNQGGMLLELKDRIRWGVGIDFDPRMVNTANRIRYAFDATGLNFYVFDLENEPLDLIDDLLPEPKADICFLLSVCMWIANWREVIDFAQSRSNAMLFESNGSEDEQREQLDYLAGKYRSIEALADVSKDDPKQGRRRFYLAGDPIGA